MPLGVLDLLKLGSCWSNHSIHLALNFLPGQGENSISSLPSASIELKWIEPKYPTWDLVSAIGFLAQT